MTYSSFEVANYFIKKSLQEKRPITPMKLQKLIYFAHGWNLGLAGKPLINELISVPKATCDFLSLLINKFLPVFL